MKRLFFVLPMLMMSVLMVAEPKPLRVVVLGDDPMMTGNEAIGSVGYAMQIAGLFDALVTVDVQTSPTLLPNDPVALLEPAKKGDVVLLCKMPVELSMEDMLASDVYLEQLLAIQQAAKKKGVKTIWLTPVCPRYYTAEGKQVHRLGQTPIVIRNMCKRDLLPIIDLEQMMFDWLSEAGAENTASAYVPVVPASEVAAEKAAREGYALTEAGAEKVKELIAEALRADKKNVLNKRLR